MLFASISTCPATRFTPMTYILWRRHSVASAWARKDEAELVLLAAHYAWLFGALPLGVAIGSMLIGEASWCSLVSWARRHQVRKSCTRTDRSWMFNSEVLAKPM